MGQVFYDMGFLSKPDVHECSATDLIASFVGQTGPKTVQLLEKALGKVLFIDEAYRLGEGNFATEAINELVDSLTKPRFAGKIIVILAGYEDDMNQLMSVNQGLSSRFSEEILFTNMKPEDCWRFLQDNLRKLGIAVEQPDTHASSSEIIHLFQELSSLPSWGNGRDVQTISKSITSSIFQTACSPTEELKVSQVQIIENLTVFLAERQARSKSRPMQKEQSTQLVQDLIEHPRVLNTMQSAKTKHKIIEKEPKNSTAASNVPPSALASPDLRDEGVTDEIWHQLEADKAAQSSAQKNFENFTAAAEQAAAAAKEIEILIQKAKDEELQELKRKHEEARLKQIAALRVEEKAREEAKKEARVQAKLKHMGVCVAGFQWIRQAAGYRCSAGGHFVSHEQLNR